MQVNISLVEIGVLSYLFIVKLLSKMIEIIFKNG